jgi:hypothetical protein
MVWTQRLWLRLQTLFRRSRSSQQLDDEIQFHLEQQIAENIALGMSGEEARYAALRAFGNPTLLKERTMETWGWGTLEQIGQDLRYGFRTLCKNPGFMGIAVMTLTLGIGATSAMFSVVDAVLLRSLPYRNPSRLVSLYEDRSRTGFPRKLLWPPTEGTVMPAVWLNKRLSVTFSVFVNSLSGTFHETNFRFTSSSKLNFPCCTSRSAAKAVTDLLMEAA